MYKPDKTKDKAGINIKYNNADGGEGLRDAIDRLMEKCNAKTGDPRSTFVRQLLAELLLPGHGNRIISQLDLSGLGIPTNRDDTALEHRLERIQQTLDQIERIVKFNRNDVLSLATNALAEFGEMELDQATQRVRDAIYRPNETEGTTAEDNQE